VVVLLADEISSEGEPGAAPASPWLASMGSLEL
jgi:hypothetical protein